MKRFNGKLIETLSEEERQHLLMQAIPMHQDLPSKAGDEGRIFYVSNDVIVKKDFSKLDKPEVLYEIYAQDRHWYGDLSEIISGLESNLDSRFILPHFGERRVKCQRKCLAGEKCVICEAILECSKTLQEAGLLINIKEDEKNG